MAMLDESSLRPLLLSDFAGQHNLKEQLKVYINSAKSRNDTIEHILLSGPPGLGKTSLAHIIANEMNTRIIITSGIILRFNDIISILFKLKKGDILFIDEIHSLNRNVEELLYPVMEDFKIDVAIELGGQKMVRQVNLEKFTLIGATTRNGMISNPLRDRFGISATLELYNIDELTAVVVRSASLLNISITYDGAYEIARRAHGTPRIANSLLRRVRDFGISKSERITRETADHALTMIGIDEMGLGKIDRKILKAIACSKKPIGVKAIASMTGEDIRTIEEVYEPYLLRIEFITLEKSGRQITSKGRKHLGIKTGNEKEDEKKEKKYEKKEKEDEKKEKEYEKKEKEEKQNKYKTEEDAYEILGVPPNATDEQIKKAYRLFATMWHTDVNKTVSDNRMKELNWAYDLLKKKRGFT